MQRLTALILALSLFLPAIAQAASPAVPRIAWTVETSAPVARRLDLRYGETVDLECRFLSYNTAMDILGGTVTLHARTNGMADGSSFQHAGTAGSNGLASVRLAVDAWLPQGLTNVSWTLECVQTNAVRLLRASGTAVLTGTSSATTNDPVPTVWLTNITAQIAAATGSLAQAYSAALSNLSASVDSLESFALTNRVTTWPDSADPTMFWIDNGTNRVKYSRTLSGTNYVVALDPGFLELVGDTRPSWETHAWPFSEDGWTGYVSDDVYFISFGEAVWSSATYDLPRVLAPVDPGLAKGLATVSIADYSYATNIVAVYSLTTGNVWQAVATVAQAAADAQGAAEAAQADINGHAPPGTIAAPHLLLGDRALIDSVTSKAAINGGVMTNATLAGTVNGTTYVPIIVGTTNELPIVANRTNGVLYVEIP